MRRHQAIGTRLLVGITALGLATTGSALAGVARSDAAGTCGGAPADVVGTFVAHRTPPENSPDHADDQPLTVTLTEPDRVSTDNKAIRDGKPYATQKGSGTFSVSPLTWTEKGTRSIGDKSGPYEMTFKATKVECGTGTQVSGFTGTFSSSQTAVNDTETYARQQ